MTQYITDVQFVERTRCLVAQVWILGGTQVAAVKMAPDASHSEAWDMAAWLYDKIVEQDLARDHVDTNQSVLAASYPI